MELNYRNMWELANLRQKQIDQISLEKERYNTEHNLLVELKNILGKLQRLGQQKQEEQPVIGEVKVIGKEAQNV